MKNPLLSALKTKCLKAERRGSFEGIEISTPSWNEQDGVKK